MLTLSLGWDAMENVAVGGYTYPPRRWQEVQVRPRDYLCPNHISLIITLLQRYARCLVS